MHRVKQPFHLTNNISIVLRNTYYQLLFNIYINLFVTQAILNFIQTIDIMQKGQKMDINGDNMIQVGSISSLHPQNPIVQKTTDNHSSMLRSDSSINGYQCQYQEIQINNKQNDYKNIIRNNIFKNEPIKLKKNKNMPKFICTIFLKYFYAYLKKLGKQLDQGAISKAKYMIEKERKNKYKLKNAKFNLSSLNQYFGIAESAPLEIHKRAYTMRLILHHIISDNFQPEIYRNSHIVLKEQYAIMMKIFRIRLKHCRLVCRNQAF